MSQTIGQTVRDIALQLMSDNRESDPELEDVYLFPSEDEIRLIYLDPNSTSHRGNEYVSPFYFGKDKQSGFDFLSAIALIRPEEREILNPPEGWGTWNDAEIIRK